MSIFTGSRYEYSLIDYFATRPNGPENPTVFYDFPDLGVVTYSTHTVVEGERLDSIANRYYQRSGLWWYIMDYNPEIKDILNIPAGTVIRIPSV